MNLLVDETVKNMILPCCLNKYCVYKGRGNAKKRGREIMRILVLLLATILYPVFSEDGVDKKRSVNLREKISSEIVSTFFSDSGSAIDHKDENRQSMSVLGQIRKSESKRSGASYNVEEVYVYIYLNDGYSKNVITPYVSELVNYSEKFNLAAGWITPRKLADLSVLDAVRFIRTVFLPTTSSGLIQTPGDSIQRTKDVREVYGEYGAGIKIGIISDGVDSRLTAQQSGDLPDDGFGLTVLRNSRGGEEGVAMMEIIYDMVPEAELFFHDCGSNVLDFNDAIDELVKAGCRIICDDIIWTRQPFFEDGEIAQHIDSVLKENDIIYISSAGNNGKKHYQGMYRKKSTGNEHNFDGGSGLEDLYVKINARGAIVVVLQWDDKFGISENDYNLFFYNSQGKTLVASSINVQDGDDDPLEYFTFIAPETGDYTLTVEKVNGEDRELEIFLYTFNSSVYEINVNPEDAVFGHAAHHDVIAVGAINAADDECNDIEPFSSQGPSTIVYPEKIKRAKPDICGIDGVAVTGAGGFPSTFFGTSAAVPHIAAIMAQLWAQSPTSSRDQIKDWILNSAVDLGDEGHDNVYGTGRADAFNAFLKTENVAPVINDYQNDSINAGYSYSFVPNAYDVNPDDVLSYYIENKPPWGKFDTLTGELSGIPSISDTGSYSDIVINVKDNGLLNFSTAMSPFSIYVEPSHFRLLASGWNMIAFPIAMDNMQSSYVLGNIDSLKLIKDDSGNVYIPEIIDQVDTVRVDKGYMVYTAVPDTLYMAGDTVDVSSTISLREGWNLLPYFLKTEMSVNTALATIIDKVVILKDDDGGVFIPDQSINTVGNLRYWNSYNVYMKESCDFKY